MRHSIVTKGIILDRTDYGEADRILTFITPDHGKVKAIAKGVRKTKSKLAGGIELFSVSDLTYIIGRKDISTLISTRLDKHYGNIVKEITRTNAGYEIIKMVNKVTEEATEADYFNLLKQSLEALDDLTLDPMITSLWFNLQLLKLTGHTPNLQTDISGRKLEVDKSYDFHFDEMKFSKSRGKGNFNADLIKFLRLGLEVKSPRILGRVEDAEKLSVKSQPLTASMLKSYIRL